MENNQANFSCIIVDDETLAQNLIRQHLSDFDSITILDVFHDPIKANEFLATQEVDIIFLDIEMPNMNGIQFIKQLKNSPKIILTTAYTEFALEGFELNVVDYLLKPIVFDRFQMALEKAIKILQLENASNTNEANISNDSIVIKSSHELVKINVSDILFVEGLHKYVKITTTEKNYTILFGLTALMNELPSVQFFRCHRSFIVNIEKVTKISGNDAIIDSFSIPISRGNKSEILQKMGRKIG